MVDEFAKWLDELDKVASADGAEDYVHRTGTDNWQSRFDDGLDPEEAWQSEKDAVSSMGV